MKGRLGVYAIALLVALNILLWLVFPPSRLDAHTHEHDSPAMQQVAEMLSSSAMILWACGIFLSNKPRFLEPYFGGLDRMYIVHKNINILALLLILVHLIIVPTSENSGPGVWIGWVTFPSILILVLLSVSPRVPLISSIARLSYDRWRNLHRYMGVLYILGATHMLMVEPLIQHSSVVFVYVETIIVAGVLAYLYRQFLWERLKRREPYHVQDVARLNGAVAQVTLRPQGKPLRHRAGQFLYVHFESDKTLREPHPFTISSAPHEPDVRLSIKSSGDWTQHLHEHLAMGARAYVDGPYGEFDYKTGGPRQLWIAAGIGITPFLSWIRDLQGDAPKHEIDFFYTTTVAEEALFLDEIHSVAARPGFRAHVLHTARDGRLSVKKIAELSGDPSDRDIYMCGPIAMIEAFRIAFMARGVPRRRIHYEEFNFR
jgi:predicted ferric reductase